MVSKGFLDGGERVWTARVGADAAHVMRSVIASYVYILGLIVVGAILVPLGGLYQNPAIWGPALFAWGLALILLVRASFLLRRFNRLASTALNTEVRFPGPPISDPLWRAWCEKRHVEPYQFGDPPDVRPGTSVGGA
jgi:hypothetical protein